MKRVEVLFTPADFAALKQRKLDDTLCVVFDIFRATSSIITALGNGATAVIPVSEISEALVIKQRDPKVLLAGERDGLRIRGNLTGGIDFDLGNSPREFTREKVAGKTIVTTTTNGTRALRSCTHARKVLIGSFLNLTATADVVRKEDPATLMLICSGTFEETAMEDVLGAGALCDALQGSPGQIEWSDSAAMSHRLYQLAGQNLLQAASESRNGRKLLANSDLRDDVPFSLQRDTCKFAAELRADGTIQRM